MSPRFQGPETPNCKSWFTIELLLTPELCAARPSSPAALGGPGCGTAPKAKTRLTRSSYQAAFLFPLCLAEPLFSVMTGDAETRLIEKTTLSQGRL